jgi:hypothetical protein
MSRGRFMLRPLSLAQHTLFAELLEQGCEDLFDAQFPENGTFLVRRKTNRAGAIRSYAYYHGYRPATDAQDRGTRYSYYIGPADDPAIGEQIARFNRIKAVRAERSSTVGALIGAGMPRPQANIGRTIEGLARAGYFPSRAVLIGLAAYQTYSGVLGVRLSKILGATGDENVLMVHHGGDGPTPGPMATLGPRSVAAQPTRLLDFLIAKPVRSIVLHGPGIAVTVPSPERYAVHALIVHGLQGIGTDGQVRTTRDLDRATELVEALGMVGRDRALVQVFAEAWEREPTWRVHLSESVSGLPGTVGTTLKAHATKLSERSPVPASSRPRIVSHEP